MKPHGLVGPFPNRQNVNKEDYDSIDAFIKQLKEDIGEHIAKIYVRYITDIETRDDDNEKVFLPHHTSNRQYYAQWCLLISYFSASGKALISGPKSLLEGRTDSRTD